MRLFVYTFLTILLYQCLVPAQNEKGSIYGIVTDAVSNQPLFGVNIILIGTNYGAATDDEGKFEIKDVPVNTY
jgi:hypothetical protein